MRGSTHIFSLALAAGLVLAVIASVSVFSSGHISAALAQASPSLAIDVDPTGNTATSLGTRQVCIEAVPRDRFDIDITVDNVEELSAWEAYLQFDNSVVNVVDRDVQLFLASSPGANAFDISASVPHDEESPYRIGAANIADPPQGVTGSGVLARLTLEAVSAGTSDLTIGLQSTDTGNPVGPTLTDVDANRIGDSDDDTFFDAPTLDAKVAVGETCADSEGSGPVTALGGGDDGGIAWWIFLAAALGLIVTAGAGGVALITLRRTD